MMNTFDGWTEEEIKEFFQNKPEWFDSGDHTTKELKQKFPLSWRHLDEERAKLHEMYPEYYRPFIEKQQEEN